MAIINTYHCTTCGNPVRDHDLYCWDCQFPEEDHMNYKFSIRPEYALDSVIIEIKANDYISALELADALQDGGEQTWTNAAEVVAAWRID